MAKTPLDVEAVYARILKLLRTAIQSSGRVPTEVDEAIGRRRGHLEHVFDGRTELKVRELLELLRALELDPSHFLGPLVVGTRPRSRPRSPEELLAQLAERVAAPVESLYDDEAAPEVESAEEEPRRVPPELRSLVEEYLDQFLARPRRAGKEGEGGEEIGGGGGWGEEAEGRPEKPDRRR